MVSILNLEVFPCLILWERIFDNQAIFMRSFRYQLKIFSPSCMSLQNSNIEIKTAWFKASKVSFILSNDFLQLAYKCLVSSIILQIPATNTPEDLKLFASLCRKDYFQGNHHVEEIMYLENLRRSQLLQLLEKFRDVLITYETEDPAIAMFSSSL